MDHPFADVEAMLLSPPADGLFVRALASESPLAQAGLALGDVITAIRGQEVRTLAEMLPLLRAGGEDREPQPVRIARGEEELEIVLPPTTERAGFCPVKRGIPAWTPRADYEDEPVFGVFSEEREYCLLNHFAEDPAGYEVIRVRPHEDDIEVATWFRLGEDGENGWEYCTRGISLHRLDRTLSVIRTAFYEGRDAEETEVGDVVVDLPGIQTGYVATLLPLVMPLIEGASQTFLSAGDGRGVPQARDRIECIGERTVRVGKRDVRAFGFAWRHYGSRPPEEDEHFYVTPDRDLVRIDWGPDYGGCWAEKADWEAIMTAIPTRIRPPSRPFLP